MEGSDALLDCKCVAGYTAASDGLACEACEAGTYKAATGVGLCSACPAGTSCASGSDELEDCKCVAGYSATSDGAACTACDADTYKSDTGVGQCSACPAGTNSAGGSRALIDCKCSAGYSGSFDGAACTACDAGTYKVAPGAGHCSACPAGTSSSGGGTQLVDCKCLAGYTAASDGVACSACKAGTHKDSAGAGGCVECPAHSACGAGSGALSDCKCDAGYSAPDGGACTVCSDCDSVVTFIATVALSREAFTEERQEAFVAGVAQV